MTIRAKENQLFRKWKAKRQRRFFPDGVVSEKDYRKSKQKIVFILKEVNQKKPDNWDLRGFILKGERWQTWNNVTRWVKGIRQFRETGDWTFQKDITQKDRIETLKSICVMNLKKTPGGGSTKPAELKKFAEEDEAFIRKQYSFYNPDITICGNTGSEFRRVMGKDSDCWKNEKSDWVWWYERKPGKYVIYTWHPQAHYQAKQFQKELMDVIRKIYK